MVQAQDTVYIPQDYPSIQQGIDAAVDGDFVLVDDGTYLENINFNGKAITLASYFFVDGDTNHINNTIVDGSQPTDPDYGSVVTFNNGEDTTSVICGFTITGGTGTLFPMEQARSGGGILCYNAGAKIIHNVIISNQINHTGNTFGGGIALSSDGSEHLVVLQENSILNNINITTGEWAYGGGICTYLDTRMIDNLIANNSIEGNDAVGGGVICYSMTGSNHILLKNNVINGNEIIGHDVWGGGVGILFSNAEISGNQFNGNVINCERGWGGGVMTQGTIDTLNIIDNEFSGNHIDASDFCVGGGAMFHSPTVYARYAGNVFSDNTAGGTSYGGGLTCNNSNNIPILVEGNLFSDNNSMAGGGVYTGASNIRFVNNLFCSNSVDGAGGGIYVTITTKDISNSGIWQIQGPHENIVQDILRAANISFVNNTFVANQAVYNGGAMRVNYTTESCLIMNSIFWENDAVLGDDIHYSGSDTIQVNYSDINSGNIYGNWTGEGNINEDPLFDLSGPHPYALSSGSPCIDTGTPDTTGLCLPDCDIIGCCRIWDGDGDGIAVIDMGAYEFGAPLISGTPQPEIHNPKSIISAYPNPFHSSITIEFELKAKTPVTLHIYNHMGQQVAKLLNEIRAKGQHQLTWNAAHLPPGLYFLRLQAGNEVRTGKVIKQ